MNDIDIRQGKYFYFSDGDAPTRLLIDGNEYLITHFCDEEVIISGSFKKTIGDLYMRTHNWYDNLGQYMIHTDDISDKDMFHFKMTGRLP